METAQKPIARKLEAVVYSRKGNTAKVHNVTDVRIRLGDKTVTATLGGFWKKEQALREFQRLPWRFTKNEEGMDLAHQMGLVA